MKLSRIDFTQFINAALFLIILLGMGIYGMLTENEGLSKFGILGFWGILCICGFQFAIFLRKDWKKRVWFNSFEKRLIITINGQKKTIPYSDIKNVVLVTGQIDLDSAVYSLPFKPPYYFIFNTPEGSFTITCLTLSHRSEFFRRYKFDTTMTFFPLPL